MPHTEQDPLKDATPTADAGALVIEGAQAVRASTAAASGGAGGLDHDQPSPSDAAAQLAPEDADRFAMAFRPSWEPLAPDAAPAAMRSHAPSVGPRVSAHPAARDGVQDVVAGQDELLRLRGRSARKRSITLAAVSVLSFAALVYWGISTTTSGTERAATRSLVPPPAAEPERAPTPEPARAAPLPERTGLTARLADPSAPAAEPKAAAQAESEDQALPTEPAAADTAEQVAAAAEAPAQPSAAEQAAPQPAAAAPVVGSDSPNSTTSLQPATAIEAQPAVAALQPGAASAAAKATDAKPAASADAQPTAAAPSAPAQAAKPAAAAPASAPLAVAAAAPVKPAAAAPASAAAAPASAPPSVAAAAPAKPAAADPGATAAAVKPPAAAPVATAAAVKPAAAASAASAAPANSSPAAVAKAAPESKPAEPATPAGPPLLVVRAVPDNAQLWLDGQKMPNPFDTRLPLGSKHKIEARQDGYEASSQTIRLESDARLTITLKRETPPPAPHIKVQPLPESSRGAGFVTANPY